MKSLTLMTLSLMFSSATAMADAYPDSFEDTPEFNEVHGDADASVRATSTWAYSFELIKDDGTTVPLSSLNINKLVKPASTMKLFTGWMAYNKKTRTLAYLREMLQKSINSHADNTLKKMGGMSAMKAYYNKSGITLNSSNFVGADGSGLSYDNRANCAVEMTLLKSIRKNPSYIRFRNILAQPQQVGTLEHRLPELAGKLFAKTGTLLRIPSAGLSGFVETDQGTMAFCVLSENISSVDFGRKKIDAMVRENVKLANKTNKEKSSASSSDFYSETPDEPVWPSPPQPFVDVWNGL